MSTCVYCGEAGPEVETVATCNGTCDGTIHAHPDCFTDRRRSNIYRKTMKKRGNRDAELCPHPGCMGKVSVCKKDTLSLVLKPQAVPKKEKRETVNETCDKPCGFLSRDGLPCRREAVGNTGACRHHQRDRLCLEAMVERKTTRSVETQTDTDLDDRVRRLELEAAEATARLRSIRTNVLELLMDDDL